jgi:hypothetical protein
LANYFLDTSAFVKRSHPETGTERVLALFDQPANQICVSRLTRAETRSAYALRVRTGHAKPRVWSCGLKSSRISLPEASKFSPSSTLIINRRN